MQFDHTFWIALSGIAFLLVLLGFLWRRPVVRAAQLCLLIVAMPLCCAFAASECGGSDNGFLGHSGCSCGGGTPGSACPTAGSYQAAVPLEGVQSTDEAGAKVDVSGSAVVGPVKSLRR